MATKTVKTVKTSKGPSTIREGTSRISVVPTTMEELLAGAGTPLKIFKRGDTVTGKIAAVGGRMVYVDVGGKTEAVVAEAEYETSKDYLRSLKPGDDVTGVVVVLESDSGQMVLSLRRAVEEKRWKTMEEAMEKEQILEVRGSQVNKGGLVVELDGVYGFVPSSQLSREAAEDLGALVGQTLKVKVVEIDRIGNRLVMSEKAVSEAFEIEKRRRSLGKVKIGEIYDGEVVGIVPFGAFVRVGDELEGLVHISEISWEKVDDVHKSLKEGDKIKVKVIGLDEENAKLALSVKQLSDDPWKDMVKNYAVDSKHKGMVTKVVPYGVLVKMERGIEGLIHASKMPAEVAFAEGQEVEIFVESVDLDKRRLSLGVVLTEKPVGYK
mgnify:FL=1